MSSAKLIMKRWRFNVLCVVISLVAWLIITGFALRPVGDSAISVEEFVFATQWAPLLYLLIVIVYAVCLNHRGSQESKDEQFSNS